MNTREQLLEAIRATPRANMPRVLYADWLTEFGECDHDAATAEFIKLSCPAAVSRRIMPAEARTWLAGNWSRLMPSLASVFFTNGASAQYHLLACGRLIELVVPIPAPAGNRVAWYRVDLHFDRGFLRVAKLFSPFSHGYLLGSILKDQPLARVPVLWRQDSLARGFKLGRAQGGS